MTNREQLLYALKVQRLHEIFVLKDDIHLQYKYKNIKRATNQAATFQDKIIDTVIEDAVTGTSDPIRSSTVKNNVKKIIDTNLRNDTKRISHGIPKKAVNAAVSNISNRYQFILGNRIREEIPNLQGKIDDYINANDLARLSEQEQINQLKNEYGNHAQKRIKNIIRDSFHTNECNLSWVKAVNDGYNYKIWNNGRTKRTRAWHKAKFIKSVPIDETFDIFGSYPARMMYPGDLNGGAENVANCRCWLSYSNRPPSDLRGSGKKTTTKANKNSNSKKSNNVMNRVKEVIKKPVNKVKSKISNIKSKMTSIKSKIRSKIINDTYNKYTTNDGKYSINIREVDNPQEFIDALKKAVDTVDDRIAWRVEVSENINNYSDCRMFITEHGSTTAIREDGDIISVCAFKENGDSLDSTRALLEFATRNGGTKLDSFDGNYGFYRKCGFEPVSHIEFNEEYAPPGWIKGVDDSENVIFFKYTGKESEYADKLAFYEDVNPVISDDAYDDAYTIRDRSIKK